MFSDTELKGILDFSLNSAIEISTDFSNAAKSSCFVSNIGTHFKKIYSGMFDVNFQAVDGQGIKSSGEWMLDISVTKPYSVKESFAGKTTEKFINKELIWAIESESNTSTEAFCVDFGKLLCVKSINYLYINGMNQITESKASEYIEKRLRSVTALLQDVSVTENLYYGFFPTPGKGSNCDSIWSELKDGRYSHLGIKLFRYDGRVFNEI